ncbi:MAG: hypothetical protein OXF98_02200, partial [Rhodospirillaceae bacterium]|nr:hypothetical protein [Rhodospirillaceae bacterium]
MVNHATVLFAVVPGGDRAAADAARTVSSRLHWQVRRPMAQYIYNTNRLSKVVSANRTILRDISLSFFPGAKIGVLGLNG